MLKREPTRGGLGSTGIDLTGGYAEDEFLPQLRGPTRPYKVYREMRDNDATIGAVFSAIEFLLRQVDWEIKTASRSTADMKAAEFLDQTKQDMEHSWEDTVASLFDFLWNGWHFSETLYKYRRGSSDDPLENSEHDDGRIAWRRFDPRNQETLDSWIVNAASGDITGWNQRAYPKFEMVPLPFSIGTYVRTTIARGLPNGRSILRNCFRAWTYKRRLEEIEAIGIERDLAGLPVAWVPLKMMRQDASADDKAFVENIKQLLRHIRVDESAGVLVPMAYDDKGNKQFDIQLLSTGSRRAFDTNAVITRYDQRMASAVLADFVLIGHQSVGSYALASSKTNLFTMAIGAFLDIVQASINRGPVQQLFRMNAFPGISGLPKLLHGDIEKIDFDELGTVMDRLARAGLPLFPHRPTENWIRDQVGLPLVEEGEGDPIPTAIQEAMARVKPNGQGGEEEHAEE